MILICTQPLEITDLGHACGQAGRGAGTLWTAEFSVPCEGNAPIDDLTAGRVEDRRARMIRDTERYLSDPESKPWALLSRGRSIERAPI